MLKSIDQIVRNNISKSMEFIDKAKTNIEEESGKDKILKENNDDKILKEIELMQEKLLENRASIIEINKIMTPIFKSNVFKGVGFFSKIKALFSTTERSSDAITLMSSILGGFFILTIIPIVTTILDSNVITAIPYIGVLLIDIFLMLFSVNHLYKKHCEDLILRKYNQEFFSKNIDQETLMKISVYFDEEDKDLIKSINSRYQKITINDIVNILRKKEVWIERNEPNIKSMIQENNNRKILE